ncbi:distal tail protein Dit [Terrihalobacillus insolitus]|uniref:distal tail protein Dit n=1 Tax=Terrihalobacillus insolitus TaxID=2950438 RepID=UPI0023405185|nr:distal tail protein Dit [Terrihalobacillus insolitus]MDC3414263.1 phage tail family protein [Terrihalobacillus insolitus]
MLIFNGVDFDTRFNGAFFVDSIDGRGVMAQETNRISVPNRDGSYYQDKRRPERPLKVTVTMVGSSLEDIRLKVDELNSILDVKNPASIVFKDEPTMTYYGILDGQPDWNEIIYMGQGTLTFICPDPNKYGSTHSQTISTSPATFNRNSVAYKEDGTQAAVDTPRYKAVEVGNSGVLVEEGTTNDAPQDMLSTNWFKEFNVLVEDTGTTFKGQKVYRITFPADDIARTYFDFNYSDSQYFTGYIYYRVMQSSDVKASLYFRESGFGTTYASTGLVNTSWEKAELKHNFAGAGTSMFLLYKPVESTGDVVIEVAMPQLEQKPYATTFIGGTRSPETMTLPTDGVLFPDEGTVEVEVNVDSLMKTRVEGVAFFDTRDSNDNNVLRLGRTGAANEWTFHIVNSTGGVYRADYISDIAPGLHVFTGRWTKDTVELLIDGVVVASATRSSTSLTFDPTAYIGSVGNASHVNQEVTNVHVSRIARPDTEIGTFTVDEYTTAYLDFENRLVSQSPNTVNVIGTADTSPQVDVYIGSASPDLTIKNGTKTLRVIWNFVAGDVLNLDFKKEKITINGTIQMTSLDLNNPDFFVLNTGNNTITVTPSTNTVLEYREAYL